jgi:DNA-binding response OmpR family regulator
MGEGERPRVLVVDDDSKIIAFLKRALAYEGYEVLVAADGTSGLATARDFPPDVVVLDVMMPGLDGIEVARRLRAGESETGRLPILMLTAKDDVSDRVQGLDAGADARRIDSTHPRAAAPARARCESHPALRRSHGRYMVTRSAAEHRHTSPA